MWAFRCHVHLTIQSECLDPLFKTGELDSVGPQRSASRLRGSRRTRESEGSSSGTGRAGEIGRGTTPRDSNVGKRSSDHLGRMTEPPAYWKTARSGEQTTARGHLDQTCGNIVHPRRHLADSLDEIPFRAGMPRRHPRQPRGKSSAPSESPESPVPD